ncbi:MAG: MFS transporter [Turicibacter sp.]|nr:MFS transporter [Turicibacter sp.]
MLKNLKFRKWLVLVASFVIMAVSFSIVNNITSLFLDPVTKRLGISISSFSFVFTIGAITTALMSPVIGQLMAKVPLSIIMSLGAVLAGGGFFCYALATKIWMFYIIAIVVGIGTTCLTTIPISTALTHWFEDKKGTALGIAMAGAGTGSFIWMQIVSRMLLKLSYQATYAILGLIILVVCLPLTIFIMRMPPDTMIEAKKKEKISYKDIHWSLQLILFAIGLFLLGMSISGTKMHIQPYLTNLGHPLTFNANVGSTQAVFALLGSLIGGYVFDKLSLRTSITIFVSMALISYICLIYGAYSTLLFIFAALFGLCLCLPSLLPSYGTSALFGKEHYAMHLGFINMIFTFGGALGPVISGFIADHLSYTLVWVVYFVFTVIYLIFLLISLRQKKPQN